MSHLIYGRIIFSSFLFFLFSLVCRRQEHIARFLPQSPKRWGHRYALRHPRPSICQWELRLSSNLTIVFSQFWKKPLLSLSASAPVSWGGPFSTTTQRLEERQPDGVIPLNLLNSINPRERAPLGAYIFWFYHSLSPHYSNAKCGFLPVPLHSAPRAHKLRALGSDSVVSTTRSSACCSLPASLNCRGSLKVSSPCRLGFWCSL